MKRNRSIIHLAAIAGALALLAGCASMAFHGGSIVPVNSTAPMEYLVDYRAEGTVPKGQTYHLVETERGLAVFEKASDGSGALYENHWTDEAGDHFAAWVYLPGGGSSMHGYEFVVPTNRAHSAHRYVYPCGSYTVYEIDGIGRPVPAEPTAAVATLIPEEQMKEKTIAVTGAME